MLLPPFGIGEFRSTETNFTLVAVGQVLAKESPTRIFLGITTTVGATVAITTIPQSSTNTGWLPNETNMAALYWDRHPTLVNKAWKWNGMANATVTVYEIFYEPSSKFKGR